MAVRNKTTRLLDSTFPYSVSVRVLDEGFLPGQDPYAKVEFIVNWNSRRDFCLKMLGSSSLEISQDGSVTGVTRKLPVGYKGSLLEFEIIDSEGREVSAELPWMYAAEVERIEGICPAGLGSGIFATSGAVGNKDAPLYEQARVLIVFRPVHYKIKSDEKMVALGYFVEHDNKRYVDESSLSRYVTRFLRPVVESREIPLGRWKWAEGSLRGKWSGAPLRHTVSFLEVIYIWRQVPVSKDRSASAPPAYHVPVSVPKALGAVNKTAFDNFPAGTLQLTSVLVKPYRWWNNHFYADIIYTCKYFNAKQPSSGLEYNPPKGHNYFLHTPTKDDGSFEAFEYRLATHDGNETGIRVNREFEFRNLFRPDPVS